VVVVYPAGEIFYGIRRKACSFDMPFKD